jgi:hypothetical protein
VSSRRALRGLCWLAVLIVPLWLAGEIDARGRGGGGRGGGGRGGGFSSRGPAMSGSLGRGATARPRPSTRPAPRPSTRPSTKPSTRPSTGQGARPGDRPSHLPSERPGQGGGGEQRPDRGEGREDWQQFLDQQQQDRQNYQSGMAHQRQEWWEEEGGHYYDGYEASSWMAAGMMFAVGATLTAAAVASLSCTMTPVAVSGTTYYRCGNQWYERAFTNGQVTYVVINPPAGH